MEGDSKGEYTVSCLRVYCIHIPRLEKNLARFKKRICLRLLAKTAGNYFLYDSVRRRSCHPPTVNEVSILGTRECYKRKVNGRVIYTVTGCSRPMPIPS